MFSMYVIAQQGVNFNANLNKGKQVIGGIGGGKDGMFINVSEVLTLQETVKLIDFAKGIHPSYLMLPITINYKS